MLGNAGDHPHAFFPALAEQCKVESMGGIGTEHDTILIRDCQHCGQMLPAFPGGIMFVKRVAGR